MTKLIVSIRSFLNAPKNDETLIVQVRLCGCLNMVFRNREEHRLNLVFKVREGT